MSSVPGADETGLRVLAAIPPAGVAPDSLAERLGTPAGMVQAVLADLALAGLVEAHHSVVRLTPRGRSVVAEWPTRSAGGTQHRPVDLTGLVHAVGSLLPRPAERSAARASLLAADSDRDQAVHLLAEAFSQGRLSATELEQRTSRALAARTYGELDAALVGLGGLRRPTSSHPVRKGVFGVVAVLSSPFLLFGFLLLVGGSDADDRIAGIVLLVLLLPGVLALRRWAWPRQPLT